ncbi:NAD-dependent epimerase/dehydratase family protein [Chelativorans xinjiangense]|uniref:NAD-dependent epimerase/dehydratase family protein n=1 Tax=Chelativorans xinjiangense TaxID=2681485 RepID=UPI0024844590|nr:NAD(P)-dependent oxidoreductase [Chelativorans xinjiangense]
MNVLITGGAGWLGMALSEVVAQHHVVRAFDPQPFPDIRKDLHVKGIVGSITDRQAVADAVSGQDAVIHAAVADWRAGMHEVGDPHPFDVNVWGTYNILDAARLAGIKRIILIAAAETHVDHSPGTLVDHKTPYRGVPKIYDLTKRLQEEIGSWFAAMYGLDVVAFRLGTIVDLKLGRKRHGGPEGWNKSMRKHSWIDRYDVGRACLRALEENPQGFQVFHLIGAPEAKQVFDVARTEKSLGIQFTTEFDRRPAEERGV